MEKMEKGVPAISLDESKRIVAGKTAPKVTEESIASKIKEIEYGRHGHATLCLLTMRNGFLVFGLSAPASEANFDAEVGKRSAYENAFRQLWALEGYLLRETLWQASTSQSQPAYSPPFTTDVP